MVRATRDLRQRAEELVDLLRLWKVRDALPQALPHGQRRCLGLAMSMASNPKLLLLDEPATGMNEDERRLIIEQVCGVAKRGVTILLVEHHVKTAITLCPRLVVLDFGRQYL